jgi:hypothetical protein
MIIGLTLSISGIPVVKTSEDKDALKADALAKAKAMVEAENKKQEGTNQEEAKQGTKRDREDDAGDDGEREVKKVDTKEVEAAA